MKRREFITLLGGAAAAWPLAARAQQRRPPAIVGFLNSGSKATFSDRVAGFIRGLREMGFVEGQNMVIEYRWANGQFERLPELAAELIRGHVAVIAATGNTPSALAAKAGTATIPIVFMIGDDPVKIGLVSSFARPGGNVTGVSVIDTEVKSKRMGLVHELAPSASTVAVLINSHNPNAIAESENAQRAALALGLRLLASEVGSERDFDAVFEKLAQAGAGALIVNADAFFSTHRDRIIALAAAHTIPAIYYDRSFASVGGLMSYGSSLPDAYRQVGNYTGRILKGDKPADLPVVQPTKFEMVINLNTAKAIGLTVPPTLLTRADEVIE